MNNLTDKVMSKADVPTALRIPGEEAIEKNGFWKSHRYLFLRRLCQVLIIFFFAFPLNDIWILKGCVASSITNTTADKTVITKAQGISIDDLHVLHATDKSALADTPATDTWVLQGTLANSELFHTIPLGDPFVFVQSLSAGNLYALSGFIGVVLLTIFYFFLGGRTYCAFVCPVNIISDAASWVRAKLKLKNHLSIPKNSRIFILAMVIVVSFFSQSIAWEAINPITGVFRALVYGSFSLTNIGVMLAAIIFLLDTVVAGNLWCGHLCPVGSFYGFIGKKTPLTIKAAALDACDDCLDCYKVCPEKHVLRPVVRDKEHYLENHIELYIENSDCTRCGRCIDVCPENVFKYDFNIKDLKNPFKKLNIHVESK